VYEGSLGSGQYQPGVVYAAKRGQAQGIPTHATAQQRRMKHTQLENTNTQDKEDKHAHQIPAPTKGARNPIQLAHPASALGYQLANKSLSKGL